MADEPNPYVPEDPACICIEEDDAVRYWTRELGVDELTLRFLVRQHGSSVQNVVGAIRVLRRRG